MTKGVWRLQEVRDQILASEWAVFDSNDYARELWSWGRNDAGELGLNDTVHRSSPVQIGGQSWCTVASSYSHNIARQTDCSLWAWGANYAGQLGNNSTVPRSSPIQIPGTWVTLHRSRGSFNIARKTDATTWIWGNNSFGSLGDNTVDNKSSPIQLPGSWAGGVLSLVGSNAFGAGIKADGTLWTWGRNSQGQLGIGNTYHRSSPVQVPGTDWASVSAGSAHVIARKTDGTLWAWGFNNYGDLGNSQVSHRSSPIQIPGTDWYCHDSHADHNIASKTDGTLWTWGRNNNGQLGDNTTINRSSPIQIPGTSWGYYFQQNVIAAGSNAMAARKTDNTLWVWGRGAYYGNLGDNTLISKSSPVQIPGCWCEVFGGGNHGIARKIITG